MDRRRWVGLAFWIAFTATIAHASPLSLGDAFSTGETITASKFNNKFNALSVWANGGVGSDNITDADITDADIQASTITGAKVALDTLTAADIGPSAITASELATDAVTSGDILDATILTGDLALAAAQGVTEIEEGTWAAGTCTGGTATPTAKPTENTALRVTTTAASTNERLIATLWISVTCTSNCGNTRGVQFTCKYNTTEDDSYGTMETQNASWPYVSSYSNSYTAATGGAKNLDCYVWRSDASSISNYCARLIVQQVKR